MRTPHIGVGEEISRRGIVTDEFIPRTFSASRGGLLQSAQFRAELPRAGQKLKELIAEVRLLKPMLAQESLLRRRVPGCGIAVSAEQVAHKDGVVGKPRVGILIQAQVERRRAADYRLEVAFEFCSLENFDGVLGESFEFRVLALAKIETREFVIPGAIGELPHRPAVHFLLLRSELVLFQESREP